MTAPARDTRPRSTATCAPALAYATDKQQIIDVVKLSRPGQSRLRRPSPTALGFLQRSRCRIMSSTWTRPTRSDDAGYILSDTNNDGVREMPGRLARSSPLRNELASAERQHSTRRAAWPRFPTACRSQIGVKTELQQALDPDAPTAGPPSCRFGPRCHSAGLGIRSLGPAFLLQRQGDHGRDPQAVQRGLPDIRRTFAQQARWNSDAGEAARHQSR